MSGAVRLWHEELYTLTVVKTLIIARHGRRPRRYMMAMLRKMRRVYSPLAECRTGGMVDCMRIHQPYQDVGIEIDGISLEVSQRTGHTLLMPAFPVQPVVLCGTQRGAGGPQL